MRKILLTGAAGYIGSVLLRQLLNRGYSVRGVDALYFGGESIVSIFGHPNFEFVKADLRDEKIDKQILVGITDVIHLAAIVGDPACSQQPELAKQINYDASKTLFELSNEASVNSFIFASTCSNYGKMEGNNFVNENSELRPVSLYAELKVNFEKYLLSSKVRDDFYPTALRFSTVYGLSSRMRFDLTVNEFMRELALGKELEIFGEQFWRPYCHVEDLASACITALESSPTMIKQNVFNVGDTNENYTKKMIVDEALKFVPDAKIVYVKKAEDPRDYRVDFSKIREMLNFNITRRVSESLEEIYKVVKLGLISDPYSEKYKNI